MLFIWLFTLFVSIRAVISKIGLDYLICLFRLFNLFICLGCLFQKFKVGLDYIICLYCLPHLYILWVVCFKQLMFGGGVFNDTEINYCSFAGYSPV